MDTLEQITDKMECNGYAYFDKEQFDLKSDKPCYVPENAESISEAFSYQDLLKIVTEWVTPDYLKEHETDVESVLINMFENITWEFPYTWLEGLEL